MREILFRGKRVDNGEWAYGDYWHLPEKNFYCISDKEFNRKVKPETIGQYTGLTDKNGKKIFIDDIVEAKRPPHFQRGVVTQLSDGLYVFKGKKYHDFIDFKLEDVNLERCLSVIGNIHDNPELLEVEE